MVSKAIVTTPLKSFQDVVYPAPIVPRDVAQAACLSLPFFVFRLLLFRPYHPMRFLDFGRGRGFRQPLSKFPVERKGDGRQGAQMGAHGWHGLRLGVSTREKELANQIVFCFD